MDGDAKLKLHGAANLTASATGTFEWLVNGRWGGSWNSRPGERLLPRSQWSAAGTIGHEALTLTKGPAKGTIGFNRRLNLDWTGKKHSGRRVKAVAAAEAGETKNLDLVRITGTLAHPVAVAGKPERASGSAQSGN